MNYKKALIMYNTNAGQGDMKELLQQMDPNLQQLAETVDYFESKEKGDIEKKCADVSDYDLLISVGGDGTFHELINGCYQNDLHQTLGLLPAGSFNDFSKTLKLSPDLLESAEILPQCQEKEYDVLVCNDRVAMNFWAIGFPVENAENVDSDIKEKAGVLAYVPAILTTLKEHETFDYHLVVDGKEYKGSCDMIFIANGEYAAGVEIPLTDLKVNDGILHLFIMEELTLTAITDLAGEKTRKNFNELSNHTELISGQEMEILEPIGKTIDMDGELAMETPCKVQVIPKRFKILTNI